MPEARNQSEVVNEAKTPEGEGSPAGLEIEKTAEFEKASGKMSEIQDAIDHNQPVTAEAVNSLNEALTELTINVGGEEIPFKELKGNQNIKIWREIQAGNFENIEGLSFLPQKVAEVLISGYKGSALYLSGIRSLDKGTAEKLAEFKGNFLHLNSLTSLSKEIAEQLIKFEGSGLHLGCRTLDKETAEKLSKFGGDSLSIIGLTLPEIDLVEKLIKFGGNRLSFYGFSNIDKDIAKKLAEFNGKELCLNYLTTLNKDAAEKLAEFNGNELYLNGLTKLDKGAAEKLAGFKGDLLGLDGLDPSTVTNDQAEKLAGFGGAINTRGGIRMSIEQFRQ